MGSPVAPNLEQYTRMQRASELAQLTDMPASLPLARGTAELAFPLPRQGVSLIVLEL